MRDDFSRRARVPRKALNFITATGTIYRSLSFISLLPSLLLPLVSVPVLSSKHALASGIMFSGLITGSL